MDAFLYLPLRSSRKLRKAFHALAKIFAHVSAKDQILALVTRQRAADGGAPLPGHFERDRRMARNELGGLVCASLQGRDNPALLIEKSERQRLRRFDRPCL